MATCFVKNDGSKKMAEVYGETQYRVMEEWGIGGVSPEIRDRRTGNLVTSSLYQDIYNRLPSTMNPEERGIEAFYIYTQAYSDKFIEKYGDWTSNPEGYKVGRYSSTGEPKLYVLEEEGLFKDFKESRKLKEGVLDKAVRFLETTLKELENNLAILKRKASKSDIDEKELDRLNVLISRIQNSIETKKIESGVKTYLSYLQNEILPVYLDKIESLGASDDIDSATINEISGFLDVHSENLQRLHRTLSTSKEYYNFFKSEVEAPFKEIRDGLADLNSFVSETTEDIATAITVDEFKGDLTEEQARQMYKDTVKDVNILGKLFGIPSTLSDPIIRMISHMVKKIDNKIKRIVQPVTEDLIIKQDALNKAGFKDMGIFNEDGTGYLVSDKKWGEYYTQMQERDKNIVLKTDYETIDEVKAYVYSLNKEQRATDEVYKIYRAEMDKFDKKYRKNGKPNPPENKQFNQWMKNPAFAEYYKALYNIHSKAKELQPSTYRQGERWWLLPQISKRELTELIKDEGLKGAKKFAKRTAKEIVKTTEEDIEYGEVKRDKNGNILKLVPLHYNSKVDVKDLSDDISSMYHKYYTMAVNFREISKSKDDIELIYRAMGAREIKTPKSLDVVKHTIESHLYGKKIEDETITIGKKEYNMSKLLDIMFVRYPSVTNMFMNNTVAMSGFFKSQIDSTIEDITGNFTTVESSAAAVKEYMKQLPRVMSEIGNKVKSNKLDLLLRHNQVDDVIRKAYEKLNIDTKGGRMLGSDLVYANMLPFSYTAVSKTLLSTYFNYRLVDGKFTTKGQLYKEYKNKAGIKTSGLTDKEFKKTEEYKEFTNKWKEAKNNSLYDAYNNQNGKLTIKPEYKKYITEDFETEVSLRIQELSNRVEGKLGGFDKGVASRSVAGRAVMLHRSWIPQLAAQRFKKRGRDFDLGEESEGFYQTIGRLTKKMLFDTDFTVKAKLGVWKDLDDFERRNVIRFITDAAFLLGAYILATVFQKIADDDEEDTWFIEYQAYLANRLLLEQRAFWAPAEFFSLLKSPAAAINQWEKITNMGSLLFNGTDVIKSGAYKDKTKVERFLIQQSLLKNLYELQHPKPKNSYLRSQML